MIRSYIVIFFVVSTSISVKAQGFETHLTKVTDTTYNTMYSKLKELYTVYKNSDSHRYSDKLMETFVRRARFTMENIKLVNDQKAQFAWIAENIDNTDFKDYDAAVAEWELVGAAIDLSMKENASLFRYVTEATNIHGNKIYADVIFDVQQLR